jgi:predicted DCC family thiol-disulfide oxidoreductase YuxK
MNGPVLLYDGLCGFCDGVVQFVLRRDRVGTMRFAALQGDYARGIIEPHADLHGVDSLVLVDATGVHVRSDAAIAVAEYLGGAWAAASILRVIPRFARDLVYDAFARARYTLFGRLKACRIPAAAQRERFLD